ncbi:caspase family protein [Streptomyces sp. HPF1205]|uniref:caspase family protein n=1 Tax=Streptomyces sp. HPF1205 TaxID=2873262 RepID=UPI001CECDD80|nr:caspase family protein [Streptomyces sp. HPF1205]
MPQHRALLIGASNYDMRGIHSLPFIPADLARLGSAFRRRGFHDVQILSQREGGKQISANFINARVAGFLRRAGRGDTLVIFLSGHGVHAAGRDYLVPEDIDEDTHPFESGCVPIDWRPQLDETLADHVVFLIDACREGIEATASMSVAGVTEWGRQKTAAALRRKVGYVYGCSPAQFSLYVRDHEAMVDGVTYGTVPGESFSLFSRAVSDVVASHQGALTLDAFRQITQERVSLLHQAYQKRGNPQQLRAVTDIHDAFTFLPAAGGHEATTAAITPPVSQHPATPSRSTPPPRPPAAPPRPSGPPRQPGLRRWQRNLLGFGYATAPISYCVYVIMLRQRAWKYLSVEQYLWWVSPLVGVAVGTWLIASTPSATRARHQAIACTVWCSVWGAYCYLTYEGHMPLVGAG